MRMHVVVIAKPALDAAGKAMACSMCLSWVVSQVLVMLTVPRLRMRRACSGSNSACAHMWGHALHCEVLPSPDRDLPGSCAWAAGLPDTHRLVAALWIHSVLRDWDGDVQENLIAHAISWPQSVHDCHQSDAINNASGGLLGLALCMQYK